jgi:hypothetical protein
MSGNLISATRRERAPGRLAPSEGARAFRPAKGFQRGLNREVRTMPTRLMFPPPRRGAAVIQPIPTCMLVDCPPQATAFIARVSVPAQKGVHTVDKGMRLHRAQTTPPNSDRASFKQSACQAQRNSDPQRLLGTITVKYMSYAEYPGVEISPGTWAKGVVSSPVVYSEHPIPVLAE